MLVSCGSVCEEAHLCGSAAGVRAGGKLHFPASSRCQNYLARKLKRDSFSLSPPSASPKTGNVESLCLAAPAIWGPWRPPGFEPRRGFFAGPAERWDEAACHRCLTALWGDCRWFVPARVPLPSQARLVSPGCPGAGRERTENRLLFWEPGVPTWLHH